MKFKVPKLIGELQIQTMMAGSFAVVNNVKSAPNKIIVACRDYEHCLEIMDKIKKSKSGDTIFL